MATSTPSGTVAQYNLSGSQILYTDTGTYTGVISRTLVISDYLGNVVQTVSMGGTTTYIFTITADAWYQFVCTVVDANSPPNWVTTVYFTATGFFTAAYLNQYTANNCGCVTDNSNLEIANNAYLAALRFNLAGVTAAANAQVCIQAANYFVNVSPVVQFS